MLHLGGDPNPRASIRSYNTGVEVDVTPFGNAGVGLWDEVSVVDVVPSDPFHDALPAVGDA